MDGRLFLSLLFIQCFSLSNGCPHLWHEYNGSCYRLFNTTGDFNDAKWICETHNSNLTIVLDQAENDFLNELFYLQEDVPGDSLQSAFIGLVRNGTNSSTFLWLDGTPLVFNMWAGSEPSNSNFDEDVAALNGPSAAYDTGQWNDIDIYGGDSLICEMPLRNLSVSSPTAVGSITKAIYVDRLVIEVTKARSLAECFQKCIRVANCLSSNFSPGAQSGSSTCVLNAATTKEQYANVTGPGTIYYGEDAANWIYLELPHL